MNTEDVTESIGPAVGVSLNDTVPPPAIGFDRISLWRLFIATVVLLWFGVQMVNKIDADMSMLTLYMVLVTHGGLFCVALAEAYFARIPFRLVVGSFPSKSDIVTWVPMVLCVMVVSTGAYIIQDYTLAELAPGLRNALRSLDDPLMSIGTPVTELLVIVVLAPVVEEFVFRGIVLRRFIYRYSPVFAILLSSSIFGLLHFQNPVGIMFAGVFLAYAYLATGSLWVSVMLHAANNALASVLEFIEPTWSGNSTSLLDFNFTGGQAIGAFLVISLSVAVMIWWLKRRGVSDIRSLVDNSL